MSFAFGEPTRRLALSERSESKGGSNSVVESQPSKLLVAGSITVSRSSLRSRELTPKRELRLGEPDEGCLAVACSAGRRIGKPRFTNDAKAGLEAECEVADLSAVAASEASG